VEVETAVRRMLLADPTVNGYVAGKGYKHRLDDTVEGTGGMAFVVRRTGGWAKPDTVKSAEYPLVEVQCWADHDRTADGGIATANAEEKAWALFRAVDRLMHGVRGVEWGRVGDTRGLQVIGSSRWREGSVLTTKVPGKPNLPLLEGLYVSVEYAVQCYHGSYV